MRATPGQPLRRRVRHADPRGGNPVCGRRGSDTVVADLSAALVTAIDEADRQLAVPSESDIRTILREMQEWECGRAQAHARWAMTSTANDELTRRGE